jgi:hypothetical protein
LGDLSQDCKRNRVHIQDVFLIKNLQNTAAVSSDEEDDLNQLQAVEQKLLSYDPTFTNEHTHASIISRRSALISAFRPSYREGDIEGIFFHLRNCAGDIT